MLLQQTNTTSGMVNTQVQDLHSAWSLFRLIPYRHTRSLTQTHGCVMAPVSMLSKRIWLGLVCKSQYPLDNGVCLFTVVVLSRCVYGKQCAHAFVSLFTLATGQRGHFIICKQPFIPWKSHLNLSFTASTPIHWCCLLFLGLSNCHIFSAFNIHSTCLISP